MAPAPRASLARCPRTAVTVDRCLNRLWGRTVELRADRRRAHVRDRNDAVAKLDREVAHGDVGRSPVGEEWSGSARSFWIAARS